MTLQELENDIAEWEKQDAIWEILFYDPYQKVGCDEAFAKTVILERKYEELFQKNGISIGSGDFIDFIKVSVAMYRLID